MNPFHKKPTAPVAQAAITPALAPDELEAAPLESSLETTNSVSTSAITAPEPVNPRLLRKTKQRQRQRVIRYSVIGSLLLVGGILFVLRLHAPQAKSDLANSVNQRYGTLSIPLNQVNTGTASTVASGGSVSVNGQLNVNQALVLSPITKPSSAVTGQLYYDKTTNQLSVYTGSKFSSLAVSDNVVASLGGITGSIPLGDGLSIVGNKLTNSGVLALGGQHGNIGLGAGLSLVAGQLQNSGVVKVVAGTNIAVSNDGNGSFTVSSTASNSVNATVASLGGTSGALAVFTGSQTIADSLLSQSGTSLTANGDLSVSGALNLGTALAVSQGGTGATTATNARSNLGAAASGNNSDITALNSLTTALTVIQGGTGATSLALNGVIVGNGTGALTSLTTGTIGLCLVSTSGAPIWTNCPSINGVVSLNSLNGSLSLNNASANSSTNTITIDDASSTAKGIASFNGSNFSTTNGAVNTIQDINTAASPTFNALTLTTALGLPSGGTGAATASGARSNLGAAASGSNNDITSLSGLTTALSVSQGGTGLQALTANQLVFASSATSLSQIASGTAGQCLIANASGAPSFQACTGAGGVSSVNSQAGALTLSGTANQISISNSGGAFTFSTPQDLATSSNVSFATVNATSFSGDGSAISNVNAVKLNGQPGSYYTNASNLSSGTLSDSRLSANVTLQGNTFNGALQLVQLTAAGYLPTLNGSLLTTLNGASITTGIIADARLSSNVALYNNPTSNFTGTLQQNGNVVCTTAGNCNGVAGGAISGSGTANKLAIFTGTGYSIGNAIVSQDASATTVSVTGALNVSGAITAASFSGDGTNVTNVNATKLNGQAASYYTNASNITTGTLSNSQLSTSVTLQGNSFNGVSQLVETNASGYLPGLNASLLTNINASALATGTVADARLSGNVALYNAATANFSGALQQGGNNVCTTAGNCTGVSGGAIGGSGTANKIALFTGTGYSIGNSIASQDAGATTVTISGALSVTGAVSASSFSGDGSAVTNVNASQLNGQTGSYYTNATNIGTGTLSDSRLSTNVTLQGNSFNGVSQLVKLDGSGFLPALNASALTSINGSNISTGTVADARLSTSVTLQGNMFNGASQLVQLNSSTQLPAVSGALLTNLNGSNVANGTVANARLVNSGALSVTAGTGLSGGGSVALGGTTSLSVVYGAAPGQAVQGNTTLTCASGTGNLSGGGNSITLGSGGSCGAISITTTPTFDSVTLGNGTTTPGTVILRDGATANTGSITLAGSLSGNQSYALPTTGGTICVLEAGNCTGANGGGVTASGTHTQNYLSKFDASGNAITNSAIYNNATGVSVGGSSPASLFNVGSTNQFQVSGTGAVTAVGLNAGSGLIQGTGGLTIGGTTTLSSLTSSGGQCLTTDASGVLSLVSCLSGSGGGSGGVASLNGLSGTLSISNASAAGSTITINDAKADGATKGIAAFNATNFTAASGVINTIQGIATTSAPTFAGLTLNGSDFATDGIVTSVGGSLASGSINLGTSSYLAGTLGVAKGGTGSGTASGARSNLGAAASGANSDITSITGLTAALAVGQGGTGLSSLVANQLLFAGSTSSVSQLSNGGSGQCLVSNGAGSAPSFQTCTGAGGVSSVNGQTGALTFTGTPNEVSVSNTGNTFTFATPQDLATTSAVTFGTLNASTLIQTNGTTRIDASGNLSNIGTINTSGLVTAGGGLTVGGGTITFNNLTGGASTCLTLNASNQVGVSTCATGTGSSPTLQNTYDNSGATPVINLSTAGKGLFIQDAATPVGGSLFAVRNSTGATSYFAVTTAGASVTGTFSATSLSGDGTNVTNVNAAQLNGQSASYYLNASNINAGTLADARLSGNVTLQGNAFNGANQLVKLDGSGYLPALNGSALTNVNAALLNGQAASYYTNASNISSGTLSDSRLSTNVAKYNDTTANFTGALQQAGYNVCTTNGNCNGVSGGAISGGGTVNKIPVYTGTGYSIGDSLLSQNAGATAVSIAGNLNVSGSIAATSFSGDGSAVTNLNASNISSGTLSDSRLSTNVTKQGNAFNGVNQLVQTDGSGYLPALNGSALTNLNASNLASGTVPTGRVSGSYTGVTGVGALTAGSIGSGFGTISTANNITTTATLQAASLIVSGNTQLTSLTNAGGQCLTTDASGNLVLTNCLSGSSGGTGGVSSLDSLSGALTINNTTGTGSAITINNAKADGTTKGIATFSSSFFGDNGSGLISIKTGGITSNEILDGTITNNDLSVGAYGNVTGTGALASGSIASGFGTILTTNSIQGATVTATGALKTGTTSAVGTLILQDGTANNRTVTLSVAAQTVGSATISLPNVAGVNDTVCLLTLANCVGAGGAVSTTGGAQNYITKYNNAGATQLTNSQLYDNGTNVGVNAASGFGTNTRLTVNANSTANNNAATQLNSGTSTNVGLVVQGASSQSADFLQVQDASARNLLNISSSGIVGVGQLLPPVLAAPVASSTGGTLATGTYYYVITALDANGRETKASSEQSVAVTGPTGSVNLSWSAVTSAYKYRIYRGTSSGNENVIVNTLIALSTTTTDTGGGSGGTPPTTGSAYAAAIDQAGNLKLGGGTIALGLNSIISSGNGITINTNLGNSNFYLGPGCTALNNSSSCLAGVATAVLAGNQIGQVLQGSNGQSNDLFQLQDYNGLVNARFNAAGNQLTLGRIATSGTVTQGKILLSDGTTDGFGITIQAATQTVGSSTITLPNTAGVNDEICLKATGNCVGQGGAVSSTATGGTNQNYLTKFSNTGGTSITNSQVFDNGTNVAVGASSGFGTSTKFTVNANSTANSTAASQFNTGSAGNIGVVIQGSTSQTGDLLETQSSTGSILDKIDSNGVISAGVIAAPLLNAPVASASGGSLASGTYYYVVTALNNTGETMASNERSVAVTGPSGSVSLSWNKTGGAYYYRVYRGTAAAGENTYYTILGNAITTFIDSGAAGTAGTPPATNNAYISQVATTAGGYSTFSGAIITNNLLGFSGDTSSDLLLSSNFGNTVSCQAKFGFEINTYQGNGNCLNGSTGLYVRPAQFNYVGQVIQGLVGQTADLLQLTNSSGSIMSKFDANGNISIGTSSTTGTITVNGGIVSSQLTAPTLSSTVTNVGTAGSTTYRYQITATDGTGETTGSSIAQTTTGNAALNATNYNTITWTTLPGAVSYNIYRCSGAACTPLKIATVTGGYNSSYNDQSNTAGSGAVPTANTTGGASFAGNITTAGSVQANNLKVGSNTSTPQFTADANGNVVTLGSITGSSLTSGGGTTSLALSSGSGGTSIASSGAISIGTGTASGVTISRNGINTLVGGSLTATQLLTASGGLYSNAIDAITGSVTINASGNSNNAAALLVQGGIQLANVNSNNYAAFTTPLGTTAHSAVSIGGIGLAANNAAILVGVTATSNVSSAGIEVYDARSSAHDPTIEIESPNESQDFGLSFDGSNTNAYLKTTVNNISLLTNGVSSLTATNNSGVGQVTVNGTLQSGSANQFKVDAAGNVVTSGTATVGSSLSVAGGAFSVDGSGNATAGSLKSSSLDTAAAGALSLGTTTATSVSISRAGFNTLVNGTLTSTQLITANGGVTIASGKNFVNAGSTLNSSIALSLGSSGSIGANTTTVDVATTLDVTTTAANLALTIPSPTVTTSGRLLYVNNVGATNTFTLASQSGGGPTVSVAPGVSASFIWNGTTWTSTAVSTGVSVIGTFSLSAQANGASISGNTLTLAAANASNPGLVSATTQSFGGGVKTFTAGLVSAFTSSNAFTVANASSANIYFNVDTSSSAGTITLGDTTSGNYATFSATGGLVANGSAQHTKYITLPAEYAGAVLDSTSDTTGTTNCSANNNGIISSGYDTSSRQNYYQWTPGAAGTQCYDVVVQIPVPSDWASWGTPSLYVYNSAGTNSTSVYAQALTTTGSVDGNYSSAYNALSSGTTLSSVNLPSLTNASYTAGGYMTLKIRLQASSTSTSVRIGNLTIPYQSKF